MPEQQSYEGQTVKLPAQLTDIPQATLPPQSYRAPQPSPNSPTTDAVRPRRNPWGQLILLVGLAWLAYALFGGGGLLPFQGGFSEQQVATSATYDARNLVLDTGAGDVTLLHGDNEQIGVEIIRHGFGWTTGSAREAANGLTPDIRQNGDTLNINDPARGFFVLFGRSPYVEYRVTLPQDAKVDIDTGSGAINASDLQGDFELHTGSGEITLQNIDGTLAIDVGSGDIRIDGSTLSNARIHTGSGDIQAEDVEGEFKASTGSGSIDITDAHQATLDLRTGSGDISFAGSLHSTDDHSISTGSGEIRVTLPDDSAFELQAQTSSGDIDVADEWQVSGDNNSRYGTIGEGGPKLTLHTSSGNIRIEQD